MKSKLQNNLREENAQRVDFQLLVQQIGLETLMVVDAEQLPSLGLLSLMRVMNQVGPILTLGQGLGPRRSILSIDLGPLRTSK